MENLGFENFFAIFRHFYNFSVYCRAYTDKAGKIFVRAFSMKMSSTFKNRQVRTFGGFLLRFSSLLYNLDSAFVPKRGQRFFSQSIKDYEKQKAHRKTRFCFSNQHSIGLPGASCYLCQYSLFSEPPPKR